MSRELIKTGLRAIVDRRESKQILNFVKVSSKIWFSSAAESESECSICRWRRVKGATGSAIERHESDNKIVQIDRD